MKTNYCELKVDSSGKLQHLTGFNSRSQEVLLDNIKRAINIVSSVLPGERSTSIDCNQQSVSFILCI